MTQTHQNPAAREVVAVTLIEATPEQVYRTSTDPEKIRRWWGCERMTMPVCENDVRVGGAYRFVGREPNGTEHGFSGEYLEVDPNRRIVHTETYDPFPGAALVTVTFEEREGKTELTSRVVFPSDEIFAGAVASGMEAGMAESIDRLAALASDRELTLTRLVDASRGQLYAAWTDPTLLAQWFAPKPLTTPVCEVDARPGGRCLTVMRTPDGQEFRNEGVFLELVPNERIVFTDAYTEGWTPSYKPFMTAIVTLEEEAGKTRYTARVKHWTVADRERHEAMGFETGWNQCLDQLIELVSRAPQTV